MMTNRNAHIQNFVSVATGGDSGAIDQVSLEHNVTLGSLKDFLYRQGIPQTEVVQEDMRRVVNGRPARYFVHAHEMARRFRSRLDIPPPTEHPALDFNRGLVPTSEIVDDILERLNSDEPQDPYELDGHACRSQQQVFYDSPEWQVRAKVVRSMDGLECRSCHRGNRELQVHHIQPILSVHSKKFYKNFDVTRMRTLCKSCHMDLHKGVVKDANGFHSASPDERQDAQSQRERRRTQHDKARECVWCQRFVWDKTPDWVTDGMTEGVPSGDGMPF